MIAKLLLLSLAPLLALGAEVTGRNKAEVRGILLMDAVTYPVLAEELSPQTRMLVGIFDKRETVVQDPPTLEGDARLRFINFAQAYVRDETANLEHLLFGQIIVNGGDNKFLKTRLVGDRELPVFFVLGENRSHPIVLDSDLRDFRYCTFISILNRYAGCDNKMPGILDDFEPLVAAFMSGTPAERRELQKQAKELYDAIEEKSILADADYYVQTMGKVMEGGVQFLREEGGLLMSRARLPMVTDDRAYALDKRLNILESFLKHFTAEPIREASLPYLKSKTELALIYGDKEL